MLIKLFELMVLLVLALICDIRTYKIKNSITVPFIIIGTATNVYLNGTSGLKTAMLGVAAPFTVLIALYALKMLGAGDIKLFCAIGGIMGAEFGLYSIAYSFLAGGIIAVILLAVRKNGFERLKYFLQYLKSCFLTFSLQPYGEFCQKNDGSKFRFAYAVISGTLMQVFSICKISI